MPAVKFLPDYIWKLNYDFQYEGGTLQYDVGCLLDKVKQNSEVEKGKAWSTAVAARESYAPHNWECLQKFLSILHQQLLPIWDHWEYHTMGIRPAESWVNIHKRTGVTIEHIHSPCPMVVSCYLKAPPGSGNIYFRNPLEYHLFGTPQEVDLAILREVEVKTNDILVFPGWLKHFTKPNETDEDRICLTLNYEGF